MINFSSFTDEFVKISAHKSRQESQSDFRKRMAGMVAAPIGTVGASTGMAMGAIRQTYTPKNMAGTTQESSDHASGIHRMAKDMGIPDNVELSNPVVRDLRSASSPGGSAHAMPGVFNGGRPKIQVPLGAHESIAAHELGHVKNHQMVGRVAKRLGSSKFIPAAAGITSGLSGIVGMKSGIATSAIAAGQKDPSYTAGGVNAAIWAPRIADEAMATGHAVRHLTKKHGLMKGLAKSAPLAPAFGSYAAFAGAPLAISAYRKHRLKQKAKAP